MSNEASEAVRRSIEAVGQALDIVTSLAQADPRNASTGLCALCSRWPATFLVSALAAGSTVACVEAWTGGRGCVVVDRGLSNAEVIMVGEAAGDTLLALTRGVEGTRGTAHLATATVERIATLDPESHDPDCLWRRAKEWLDRGAAPLR